MRGVSNCVLAPQAPSMLRMLAVLLMAVGKSGAARPTAVIRHVQLPAAHSILPKSVVAARTPEDHVSCRKLDRRSALIGAGALWCASGIGVSPALAYVKGSTPPDVATKPNSKRKCFSKEECEELGRLREAEMEAAAGDVSFERTAGGDRYRDIVVGEGPKVAAGDTVALRYRVMRLGKRTRDGLSGEAQTIFSLGYGEDDDKVGDVLKVSLNEKKLVPAIQDAVLGMSVGGKRRVLVRPERGWKLQEAGCAGTMDMGAAAGIPGALVEEVEGCLSKLEPQPATFQARRRMARRFDESLLVELELAAK